MEESEERRQQLKAMRNETDQAGFKSNLEGSGYASTTGVQYTCPSFDPYRYSMPAFSANERKNSYSPQAPPMLYNTHPRPSFFEGTPPPAYHHPSVNLPHQKMFKAPRAHYNHSPLLQSPMETANPRGMTQVTPPSAWGGSSVAFNHNNPPNLSRVGSNFMGPSNIQGGSLQSPVNLPGQRMFEAPRAHYNQSPVQSPMETANPWGMTQGTPPRAWGGSSGPFNYNNPPNLSRVGSKFAIPGNVQGGSPYADYGRGRGHRYNSSSNNDLGPYSNYGRGRGRSLGLGTSGGRRVGSHSCDPVSAKVRPDLYYKKDMMGDPWKSMTPVRLKKLPPFPDPASSSRVSVSEPSLAESLASSLYDQSSEAVDSEQGS